MAAPWEAAPIVPAPGGPQPAWASAPVIGPPRKPFDRKAAEAQNAKDAHDRTIANRREFVGDLAKSTGDTALSIGANVVMTPLAGLAGLIAAPFIGTDRAADVIHKVQGWAYTPKSRAGKQTAEVIGNVVEKANRPGEWVAEKTGSPALGAATTTILQGGIAAADPAVRGAVTSVARSAASGAVRGAEALAAPKPAGYGGYVGARDAAYGKYIDALDKASTARQKGTITTDAETAAAQSARQAFEDARAKAYRQHIRTPEDAARAATDFGGKPPPAQGATAPAPNPQATKAAQDYANSNGLDWNGLSAGVKARLEQIAATSGDFGVLDPKAVARQSQLESLPVPVPATRGQLTGDRVAIRNEGNVAATRAGQPIADIHVRANQALLDNLDVLKGKVSGTGVTAARATTPEEAGGVIQDAARAKRDLIRKQGNALYDQAKASEPNVHVSLQPVTDLLTSNPDIQHLGWVQTWLNNAAKAEQNLERATAPAASVAPVPVTAAAPEGGPVAMTEATLGELHDLLSTARDYAKAQDSSGIAASKVVDAITAAMSKAPESAKAWRMADSFWSKYKQEFADQGAVSDLVTNASRTDRTTALSNTVKAVTSGAPEQIRQIKRTLLTGGDETTRTAGRQAWREVRAQVIQQIKDDATRGVGVVEGGAPNLTPSALNSALRRFGPQKLDEIFGPGTAKQLNAILEATKTVKSIPSTGGGSVGSSTVQNALAFLEKGLIATAGKVPVVGKITAGALQAASDVGAAAKTVKQAQTTPLADVAAQAVKKGRRTRAREGAAEAARATTPLSEIAAQKSQ